MTAEEFFGEHAGARDLYAAVLRAMQAVGEPSVRVSKSQIAFRRRRSFAAVWLPGQYLRRDAAPLVLTLSLPFRDTSPRWKQVVEPTRGRFTHHLELHRPDEVDEEVQQWLQQAWTEAG